MIIIYPKSHKRDKWNPKMKNPRSFKMIQMVVAGVGVAVVGEEEGVIRIPMVRLMPAGDHQILFVDLRHGRE